MTAQATDEPAAAYSWFAPAEKEKSSIVKASKLPEFKRGVHGSVWSPFKFQRLPIILFFIYDARYEKLATHSHHNLTVTVKKTIGLSV